MNDTNGTYKYQVSKSDGKGGIYVARSNDSLEDCVISLDKVFTTEQEKAVVEEHTTVKNDHFCSKHNIQMKERSFNNKVWYDHRRKTGDEWEKCSGYGFGSELRDKMDEIFHETPY